MDHAERGKLIVINNKNFNPQTGMNPRSGTDEDAANLYADFSQLGFKVVVSNNQTAQQMLQLMIEGNTWASSPSSHE